MPKKADPDAMRRVGKEMADVTIGRAVVELFDQGVDEIRRDALIDFLRRPERVLPKEWGEEAARRLGWSGN